MITQEHLSDPTSLDRARAIERAALNIARDLRAAGHLETDDARESVAFALSREADALMAPMQRGDDLDALTRAMVLRRAAARVRVEDFEEVEEPMPLSAELEKWGA